MDPRIKILSRSLVVDWWVRVNLGMVWIFCGFVARAILWLRALQLDMGQERFYRLFKAFLDTIECLWTHDAVLEVRAAQDVDVHSDDVTNAQRAMSPRRLK